MVAATYSSLVSNVSPSTSSPRSKIKVTGLLLCDRPLKAEILRLRLRGGDKSG